MVCGRGVYLKVVVRNDAQARAQDIHPVGGFRNLPKQFDQLCRNRPLGTQPAVKFSKLAGVWQFAVKQKVGRFLIADMVSQIFDPVATILQIAVTFATLKVCDRSLIGNDAFQPWIIDTGQFRIGTHTIDLVTNDRRRCRP